MSSPTLPLSVASVSLSAGAEKATAEIHDNNSKTIPFRRITVMIFAKYMYSSAHIQGFMKIRVYPNNSSFYPFRGRLLPLFAEGHPRVCGRSPSIRSLSVATTRNQKGGSHTHCLYPPVSYPRSRCAEPWMGLSLRDGYFVRRLLASINWCRAPATPKPGPLLNRPLATSRPVSVGPKGRQRPRQGAPLRPFGYPGRAVEYAVSRKISFYRFSLPVEYIF